MRPIFQDVAFNGIPKLRYIVFSTKKNEFLPFPPDLQNIITPKPLELENGHMSRVTCHVSHEKKKKKKKN